MILFEILSDDKALEAAYPEQNWQGFQHYGFWKSLNNQRYFFNKLATKLNIKKPEDWYGVTGRTVIREGGSFINQYYNGSILQGM
jgi:hypothetical protein